jgi:hypothetical protein
MEAETISETFDHVLQFNWLCQFGEEVHCLAENVDFYSKLLQILCFYNDTGKRSFCHMKTNLCLCIFQHWIQICY